MTGQRISVTVTLLAVFVLLPGPAARGQITGVWEGTLDSNWSQAGNWSGQQVPNGLLDTALLSDETPFSLQLVELLNPVTLQQLNFDNSLTDYQIGGTERFFNTVEQGMVLNKSGAAVAEFFGLEDGGTDAHEFGQINVTAGELAFTNGVVVNVDSFSPILPTVVDLSSGALTVAQGAELNVMGIEAEVFVGGMFNVQELAVLEVNGEINSRLTVLPGGSLSVFDSGLNVLGPSGGQLIVEPGGSLTIDSGATLSTNDLQLDGDLFGAGTLAANVTNTNRLSPGVGPGTLTIQGNYSQAAVGILAIEVEGTAPGEFDVVNVIGGGSTLAGTLEVDLSSFSIPSGGTPRLTVLTGPVINRFDQVTVVGNESIEVFVEYSASASIAACAVGDMDCDNSFDGDDVMLFADALRNPDTYEEALLESFHNQGMNGFQLADVAGAADILGDVEMPRDGIIDFDDIEEFAGLIPGMSYGQVLLSLGYGPPVPEPSTLTLMGLCVGVLTMRGRFRRQTSPGLS